MTWKEPRLPTQTVLRPDRDVSLPVSGSLREVLQDANKYLGGADEYTAALGISSRGLRGTGRRKCHRRRFSAHENSRNAAVTV